ncbi:orotidine-5'-phosphate decarboxylase [Facklamia miroungae]|uniref:Orotidine 5'-phosphate decarboxylase n=1 Tax=Facklamia miroungae TaxID=120956 RepID=A0A1G7RGD6_9LACT|nr:orotidine-5'-phosphate decarboxylase [Facklamia miroungae]NKZ29423.1 orotidine-5'-phosphate decarboxylase [Facklamia miroungae]SDG09811.1 orotidine-5'-phosphate decarboxylase [Facklamia miroungae]
MKLNPQLPIIALDFASDKEILQFMRLLPEGPHNIKIGMEVFYLGGPQLLETISSQGHAIFLDLKLHDIPNTVMRSMRILAQLGVAMVNVHAAGGRKMMEAAKEGLIQGTPAGGKEPLLIAVTQLTSTTKQQVKEEQLISVGLEASTLHYASLSHQAGLDGVVCSPHEAKAIKNITHADFLTVTPGIRPKTITSQDDQHRIADVETAILNQSDWLVVGRPITQATDPKAAYLDIVEKMAQTKKSICIGGIYGN